MSSVLRARAGIALLATLLGILVLEILIAGTFHVAVLQLRIAQARVRTIQLSAAASNAGAEALARWAELDVEAVVPGGSTTFAGPAGSDGIASAVRLDRVQPSLWFLHAAAWFPGGERRAVGVLLRTASTAELLADVSAAGSAAAAAGDGSVIAAGGCGASPRAALLLGDTAGAAALRLTGTPELQQADSSAPVYRFAGIDLRSLAATGEGAILAMAPVLRDGACDTVPAGNWGAPAGAHPCTEFHPLRSFAGDVVLASGAGQGILLAGGDVTLADGVHFEGLVIAGGSLRLMPGAELHGAARAGGRLELLNAELRFDACVLERVFAAAPAVRGPFRATAHWWIPLP